MRSTFFTSCHLPRIAVVAVILGLGACQSMEMVAFQSTPPGAAVTTSNGYGCPTTPCSIEVPRKDPFTATIAKPGFAPASVEVTTAYGDRGKALLVLNTLGGGIGGAVGTEMSGQGYEHSPNPLVVTLKPEGKGRRPAARRKPAAAPGA